MLRITVYVEVGNTDDVPGDAHVIEIRETETVVPANVDVGGDAVRGHGELAKLTLARMVESTGTKALDQLGQLGGVIGDLVDED